MNSLAILGSCVSRDLFTHVPEALQAVRLGPYVSRATLISLAGQASGRVVSLLGRAPGKGFDDRRFIQDARKDHLRILAGDEPDVLMLDLIDERHATYVLDDGVLTQTKVSRNFLELHKLNRGAQLIPPFSDEWTSLQPASIRAVAESLRARLPEAVFVVHRARYASRYLDAGQIKEFADQDWIRRWNHYLDGAYDELTQRLGAQTLQVDAGSQLAGGTHLWDLTPFHYDVRYYRALWSSLQVILGEHSGAEDSA